MINFISLFPATSRIPDPHNKGALITVVNDIVANANPVDIFYGNIKYDISADGERVLDLSDLVDLTPEKTDLKAGVQMSVMACDISAPMLPVQFHYEGFHYRGVWIKSDDLFYVSGNRRHVFEKAQDDRKNNTPGPSQDQADRV